MKSLEEIGNKIRGLYGDYQNAIREKENIESENYDGVMELFLTMFPQKEKIDSKVRYHHGNFMGDPLCMKEKYWEKKYVFKDKKGNKTSYELIQSGNNPRSGSGWDYRDKIYKKLDEHAESVLFEKKDMSGNYKGDSRKVSKRINPIFKKILGGLEIDTRMADGF